MITNKSMTRSAKKRHLTTYLDLSSTTPLFNVVADRRNPLRVRDVYIVYAVASNGGTVPDNIFVGVPGDLDKYAIVVPVISQAQGVVTSATLLSTALVAPGVPLIVSRGSLTGGTNTGEVAVVVEYEIVDGEFGP